MRCFSLNLWLTVSLAARDVCLHSGSDVEGLKSKCNLYQLIQRLIDSLGVSRRHLCVIWARSEAENCRDPRLNDDG